MSVFGGESAASERGRRKPCGTPGARQLVPVPDERQCVLCFSLDSDADPCFEDITMIWGYPVVAVLGVNRNVSKLCIYCRKGHWACYYPANTTKGLPDKIGSDPVAYKKYHELLAHCIAQLKESQDIEFRIRWPTEKKVLQHLTDSANVWEEAPDLYILKADYERDHGPEAAARNGHKEGYNLKNELCVIVPESNVMKKRKEVRETTRLKRTLDEGNLEDQVGDVSMESRWQLMRNVSLFDGSGIDGKASSSSGTTMAALLKWGAGPSAGAPAQTQAHALEPTPTPSPNPKTKAPLADADACDDMDDDQIAPMFGGSPFSARAPADGGDVAPRAGPRALKAGDGKGPGAPAKPKAKNVGKPGAKGRCARPKGAAAEAATAAHRTRVGRPARNTSATIGEVITSFERIPYDAQEANFRLFFGDQFKVQSGYVQRLLKSHEGNAESITAEDEYDAHLVRQKQLWAVNELMTAYRKTAGVASPAFDANCQEITTYLKGKPAATLNFPPPVRMLQLQGKIQKAKPELFWKLVHVDSFRNHGFDAPEVERETTCAAAVACATQGETHEKVDESLQSLCGALLGDRNAEADSTLEEITAVFRLVHICIHSSHSNMHMFMFVRTSVRTVSTCMADHGCPPRVCLLWAGFCADAHTYISVVMILPGDVTEARFEDDRSAVGAA